MADNDTPMTPGGWSRRQAKDLAKRLRRRLGTAWDFMTEEVRVAMVAREVLAVATSNHRAVEPDALMALYRAILEETGR